MSTPTAVTSRSINIDINNVVTLSWQPPLSDGGFPISRYGVQYKIGINGIYSGFCATTNTYPKTGCPLNSNSRSITHSLGNGKEVTYKPIYYQIRAINSKGIAGPWRELPPVTPLAPYPAIPSITNLSSTTSGSASLTIVDPPHTNTAPVSSYSLRYRIVGTTSWTTVAVNRTGTNTNHQINNLVFGANYEFRVAGVNNFGTSQYSSISEPLRIINKAKVPTFLGVQDTAMDIAGTNRRIRGIRLRWQNNHTGPYPVTRWIVEMRPVGTTTWTRWNLLDSDSRIIKLANPTRRALDVFSLISSSLIDTTNGLPNDTYEVQIRARNQDGTEGFCDIFTFVSRYPLFNRESFLNKGIPTRANGTSHLTLINRAIDKWEKYITFPRDVFERLQQQHPGWNGIECDRFCSINDQDSTNCLPTDDRDYIAATTFDNLSDIDRDTGTNSINFYPIRFALLYDSFYENKITARSELTVNGFWVETWTHELGHALGIGPSWVDAPNNISTDSQLLNNNLLRSTHYNNAGVAYNTITNTTRDFIPLENAGGPGTAGGHWEDENTRRSNINYRGLGNELMVGEISVDNIDNWSPSKKFILSSLTIKALVDSGMRELIPGTSDGVPSLPPNVNNLSAQSSSTKIRRCGGVIRLPKD